MFIAICQTIGSTGITVGIALIDENYLESPSSHTCKPSCISYALRNEVPKGCLEERSSERTIYVTAFPPLREPFRLVRLSFRPFRHLSSPFSASVSSRSDPGSFSFIGPSLSRTTFFCFWTPAAPLPCPSPRVCSQKKRGGTPPGDLM